MSCKPVKAVAGKVVCVLAGHGLAANPCQWQCIAMPQHCHAEEPAVLVECHVGNDNTQIFAAMLYGYSTTASLN